MTTDSIEPGTPAETLDARSSTRVNLILWILQVLVALVFLWAGGLKLAMPAGDLARVSPLPPPFLKLVGVCEALGAVGLIVPWLTGIRPGLTPLAAAGLAIIMVGAVVSTLATGPAPWAGLPLAVGIASAFIAYGRWRLAPHRTMR